MAMNIYIGNDNSLSVTGMFDPSSGSYFNNATITVTSVKKESDGSAVGGSGLPLLLEYIPGSKGNYQGILQDTLVFTKDVTYVAYVTANTNTTPNLKGYWELPIIAKTRTL